MILTILRHEILVTLRQAHSWLTPVLFFIIVVSIFPLALGPDDATLKKAASAIIWMAALLSIIMSIGNIFLRDAEAGHLDAILLSSYSLTLLVLCKMVAHWLTHCLPLIAISPVLGLLLHLNIHEVMILMITLLLGTPVLTLLGSIGAALVIGLRSPGLLLPILIMPLYIPVLIFGTGAILAVQLQLGVEGYLAMLTALVCISLAFAPLLTGAALRIGVNQ